MRNECLLNASCREQLPDATARRQTGVLRGQRVKRNRASAHVADDKGYAIRKSSDNITPVASLCEASPWRSHFHESSYAALDLR